MRLPYRRETLFFFSLVVAALFSAPSVQAQVAVRVLKSLQNQKTSSLSKRAASAVSSADSVASLAATEDSQGDTEGETAKAAEKSFDERRIEALLAASVDRSLPTVLKAWSTKEEPQEKNEEKKTKKEDGQSATIVNIYQDFVILEFEKKPSFKKDDTVEVHSEVNSEMQRVGTVTLLSVEKNKVSGKFQADETSLESKPETDVEGEAVLVEGDTPEVETTDEAAEDEAAEEPDSPSSDEPETTQDEDQEPAEETAEETAEDEAAWSGLETGTVVVVRKPGDDSGKKAKEEAQIKEEVAQWSTIVTLGKWGEVKSYLSSLKEDDADKLYGHLLAKLAAIPGAKASASRSRNDRERPLSNFLSPEDILQVVDAAPKSWKVSVTGNKNFTGLGKQVAGKWKGKVTVEDAGMPAGAEMPDIEMTLDIQLDGDKVSGTVEVTGLGETRSAELDGGQYDSESGSLTFTATEDGNTMNAEMTVDDGNMTGTLSADGGGPTLRFDGELVEPADQPAEEGEDEDGNDDANTIAANGVPAGIEKKAAIKGGDAAKKVKSGQSHVPALARLVKKSKDEGFDFSSFIETLKKGASGIGGEDRDQKLIAADLFLKASMVDEVEQFLPALPDAIAEEDIVSVKVWSQLSLIKYRSKQVAKWLNRAWDANTALSVMEKSSQEEKDAAMTNMIELSSKIDKELGEKWLDESFTDSPERGMKILTSLGTKSSTMARQAATVDEGERLKLLRLQNGAVEKLLKISPDLADQWSDALTLLADNWLKEADISVKFGSSNSGGGRWSYDNYGNSYFAGDDQYSRRSGRNQEPQPIRIGDVLEIAPSEQWRKRVRPTLKIQMQGLFAKMHLHVNEEDKAFPWIEKVATQNPQVAKGLVQEFLRIWTKNHNPNDDKQRRNSYSYYYGFDRKADAIPLTRSKQQRNLEELQGWVDRIRAMDLEELDENLLANAFTTCHSSAEVYDLDRVKSVFGDLSVLKPKTIAAICERMRSNLGSNWRDIRNQEKKKTNRREPEVQKEVLRGYRVAIELATEALKSSPDNWQLHLALACLMFDENAYSQTVQKTSEFSDRRDKAFEQFKIAADNYAANVVELEKKDQKTDVYDRWFYASLGAVDLGKITNKTSPVPKQYLLIRDSIKALPGALSDAHMAKFANNMFTRMSPIKPEIKFRYLRGGFEIVEDHPRAWEARGLYDYYQDLVSELKLVAQVDGSHEIGSDEPFGVYVNLMHTQEIERESGGFGKYVQNQNSMRYSYNYGRPNEDYRDKFNDAVNQALEEHFEVQSVTFIGAEAMQSRPTDKEGWRVTPYAYLLLKSRGSEVDRIPSLKLDMDFLDTSGYAVIPIESPALVVDATRSGERPVEDLKVTQTLDERQASEGKLVLEITATGKGLVPPIEEIVDLERGSFEVVSIDDQGVLPARFDKDGDEVRIISERSWSVEYQTKEDQADVTEFSFGESKMADAVVKYQRYEDVDLVDAEQTVSLEREYSNVGWGFLYWLIPLIVIGLFAVSMLVWLLGRKPQQVVSKFDMPEEVNPFTVLTLLRDIRQRNGISNEKTVELEDSILEVERSWFGKGKSDASDLEELARAWLEQAS